MTKNHHQKGIKILITLLLFTGIYVQSTRNHFNTLNNAILTSWSHLENQLQNEFELSGRLQGVFAGIINKYPRLKTDLIESKKQFSKSKTISDKLQAGRIHRNAYSKLIQKLNDIPEVGKGSEISKTIQKFNQRVKDETILYNTNVIAYNNAIEKAPAKTIASLFDLEEKKQFSIF